MHDCLGEQENMTEEKWLMIIVISGRRQRMTWIRISTKDIPVLRPVFGENECSPASGAVPSYTGSVSCPVDKPSKLNAKSFSFYIAN